MMFQRLQLSYSLRRRVLGDLVCPLFNGLVRGTYNLPVLSSQNCGSVGEISSDPLLAPKGIPTSSRRR